MREKRLALEGEARGDTPPTPPQDKAEKELERQIKHIDPALKVLVSMRGARLKRLAPVDRPVPDKKVKIEQEAEE